MLSSSQDNILYEREMMRCLYSSDNSTISTNEESDLIVFNQISIFTKRAVSYALAQSVKLSSLENSVERLLENTQPIHEELARKGAMSLSKKEISIRIVVFFKRNILLMCIVMYWIYQGFFGNA